MKLIDLLRPRGADLVTAPTLELSANLLGQRRWPLLKPVNGEYLRSVGRPPIDLSADLLRTVAAVYDPVIEIAPLKFDHVAGGPAVGWVQRVGWDDEQQVLWIEPLVLDELREGIEAKKWGRLSAEIIPRHPETKTPYLFAVAVLGAASPAIKLPFGRPKAEGDPPLIELQQAEPSATEVPMTKPRIDPPRTDPPTATPDIPQAEPEPTLAPAKEAPAATLPPVPAPVGDEPALALSQQLTTLTRQLEQQQARFDALRLSQTRAQVALRLDALAGQINLGARAYLEPALTRLMADEQPPMLRLSQGDQAREVSLGDAIFLALEQLPALELGQLREEWAVLDDPSGPRSRDLRDGEQRNLDTQLGIADDEALALQQKYPTSDWSH